ncbi:MAG: hypothetical protein QXT38_01920 [Candidatus Aenigmatarchaeota archaeon]
MVKYKALIFEKIQNGFKISVDTIERKRKGAKDWMKLRKRKKILAPFTTNYYYSGQGGVFYTLLLTFDNIIFVPFRIEYFENEAENILFARRDIKTNIISKKFEWFKKILKFFRYWGKVIVFKNNNIKIYDAYREKNNKIVFGEYEINEPEEELINYFGKNKCVVVIDKGDVIKIAKLTIEFSDLGVEEKEMIKIVTDFKAKAVETIKTIEDIEKLYLGEKSFFEKYGYIILIAIFTVFILVALNYTLQYLEKINSTASEMLKVAKEYTDLIRNSTQPILLK